MTDIFSTEKRSWIMSRIRSRDSKLELKVRSVMHRVGLRFRLHQKTLPGTPDIVLRKHKTVVFVHGCFWHCHPCCAKATLPSTRQEFWQEKLRKNVERDLHNEQVLKKLGWKTLVIWECETKDAEHLAKRLKDYFGLS